MEIQPVAEKVGWEPVALLGPDSEITPEEQIAMTDMFADKRFEASGITRYLETGDESDLPEQTRIRLASFQEQLDSLHEQVKEVGNTEDTTEKTSRLYVFDVNNTVTDEGYRDGKPYDELLPGSKTYDTQMDDARKRFPLFLASGWLDHARMWEDVFRASGRSIPFRNGMPELISGLLKRGDHVSFVSHGFKPYLDELVHRIPGGGQIEVHCMEPHDIRALEKGNMVKLLSQQNPNAHVTFIGDGSSDFESMEARNVVSRFYALEGKSFDERLQKEQIDHGTYTDGFSLAAEFGVQFD